MSRSVHRFRHRRRRHHWRGRDRSGHRLAAGAARREGHLSSTRARPASGASHAAAGMLAAIWRPSRARKLWSRSTARARRCGPPLRPSWNAPAASPWNLRTRRHAAAGADRRRPVAAEASARFPEIARPAAGMADDRGSRAGASRISRQTSPARSGARRIIRSTIAPSPRRCASRREQAGAALHENRAGRAKSSLRRRARDRHHPGGRQQRSPPMSSCWRPAPGRAALPGLPNAALPPVRPVKGQMLALRMDPEAPLLKHVVWAPGAYLVPAQDGRLIDRRDGGRKGLRYHLDRRRPAGVAGSDLARAAGNRRTADRRDLGRSSPGQPGRCADHRRELRSAAWSMPPAIIATASC